MLTEDEWYDKRWHDSAPLVEDAAVEIKFRLNAHFDYAPEYGAQDPRELEPLSMPMFPRAAERCVTTLEAEPHVDQLIRYYADIFRLIEKHAKFFHGQSLYHQRSYFSLWLLIENPSRRFAVEFGDTCLSRMERVILALSRPPPSGEVYFDRDQCWEVEINAHDGMLYIRESDPDDQKVYNVGKMPLLSLAASSTAAWTRARKIVACLTAALGLDVWTR